MTKTSFITSITGQREEHLVRKADELGAIRVIASAMEQAIDARAFQGGNDE
jgi:hypothetical protein